MQSLISVQDKVANKEFPEEFLSDTKSDNIEVIHFNKGTQPLGATIKSKNRQILVARVLHGSLAHKSGVCVYTN